jgi:TrmH family RNA methyltransferase
LKAVRKAVTQGTTTPDGCSVAETFHLLEEALRSNCEVRVVLAAESVRDRVEQTLGRRPDVRLGVVPDALLDRLSATESSQGVLALVRPPVWGLDDLFRGLPMVVALDGVQDPGNAGAIIRAAEAFGSTGVVFLKGSANPYSPKSIRASAGSVFRVPITAGLDPTSFLAALEKRKLTLYAAMPSGGMEASRADFARGCAIVIGGEGRGVREDLSTGATAVRIPTAAVESLNAAMAAGILLYEARRQRGRP